MTKPASSTQPYYIGLDCGTSSVGWAVTDPTYHLLRAKGQTLWGAHLFDEAETAAERRTHRSARRRSERAKGRIKLLRVLFQDEIYPVDREFYKRLRESFYYEEDKKLRQNSKNTLFNDPNFNDKDYHKKYPTIWHLRQAIIHAQPAQHFDIRLYYLAIQHIYKHRGHFLIDGPLKNVATQFDQIFMEFCDTAENYGYRVNDEVGEQIEAILCNRKLGKLDKKKAIKELLFREGDELEEDQPQGMLELAGLMVGSKVQLAKIFNLESDEKKSYAFGDGDFEEKLPEIEAQIGTENLDLILATKKLYDYAILKDLLGSHESISDAMVANYDQHQADLKALKTIFRPHPKIYRSLFQNTVYDEKNPSYAAYIGQAYTEDKNGRRKTARISQEDFNKHLQKQLEAVDCQGDLLGRAREGTLLPKQRGQAKGTIPQQLHHNELELILEKLQQDYPSFAQIEPSEDESCNTKAKKLAQIHNFRIPYYCGPIVSEKCSQFSWGDEEISELVRPWNFERLVKLDRRAGTFIRRMTNNCTYLLDEPVLPKNSLLYQKFMVLNELNNLRVNGQRIDNQLKQRIYEQGYLGGELRGNITLSGLAKWLHSSRFISENDDVDGTSVAKFLPKLSTYQDFRRILGPDFSKQYSEKVLEEVVQAITVLGEEKRMLRRKIQDILDCDEAVARQLSNRSYKDWGRLSAKFLQGIVGHVNGVEMTIIDALWETNSNLMELLGSEYDFCTAIETANLPHQPKDTKITYQDVQALYCSPAVKRTVWRTLRIVNEIQQVKGQAPRKIFIEVTRGEDEKQPKGYTLARKKDLEQKLKAVRSPEAQALLKALSGYEDRELQSKKLYLYFSQMGRCAYSGERIEIEELNNSRLYDIDHIFPRSLTKDDSITRNLVLVKAELNREKTNVYPISAGIRQKMLPSWQQWYRASLITEEKFKRLSRSTPLTTDELGGFIARQIVETSQSVKAIRDLLARAYPKTKIVLVKAGQVSDFRKHFGYDKKDKDGNVYSKGRPEFIKVRELNDFHHAKDAYLNIVVGNVMNSTFTDDVYHWIKLRQQENSSDQPNYTIKTSLIFRPERVYTKKDGTQTEWPRVEDWWFNESIETISHYLKRNDVLWTRMAYKESGALSDLQLVGKSTKTEGILPIKQSGRLDPAKYGGYNSIKGAYFALIETQDKKGNLTRQIIQVPILAAKTPEQYITKAYPGSQIVLCPIKTGSLLKINVIPLHLAGRTGEHLVFYHAIQLILSPEQAAYVKKINNIIFKDQKANKKYLIDEEKDMVSVEQNRYLFSALMDKLTNIYQRVPMLSRPLQKLAANRDHFEQLDLKAQCYALSEILKVAASGKNQANLSLLVSGATRIGQSFVSRKLNPSDQVLLINQSPTGLYESIIDLQTVAPRPINHHKLSQSAED